jgi:large subunit ribosomal protein L24e
MNCTFCGKNIPRGTGLLFVKKTGQTFNFCGTKCERNMLKLKRQSRKTLWTKDYAKTKATNLAAKEHARAAKKAKITPKTRKETKPAIKEKDRF